MGYDNPLLKLPSAKRVLELPPAVRGPLEALMRELRADADKLAEESWRKRKGPMAAYWRAVSTYARHVAHALSKGVGAAGTEQGQQADGAVATPAIARLVAAAREVWNHRYQSGAPTGGVYEELKYAAENVAKLGADPGEDRARRDALTLAQMRAELMLDYADAEVDAAAKSPTLTAFERADWFRELPSVAVEHWGEFSLQARAGLLTMACRMAYARSCAQDE